MLTLAFVAMLGAVDSIEAVSPDPSTVLQSRESVRVRGGIAFAGQLGHSFALNKQFPGLGLSAEVGATFIDRYALAARLTFTTIGLLTSLGAGLELDLILNERFMLGVGASWSGMGGLDAPGASTLGVPVRLFFAPFQRQGTDVGRRGLSLFVEAMPALAYWNSGGYSRQPVGPNPFVISGMVGVGYAWW